jgi:hypothetical protein
MTKFRSLFLLAAALVAPLGLAGCTGEGGPSAPEVPAGTAPVTTNTAEPPAAGAPKGLDSAPAPAGLE